VDTEPHLKTDLLEGRLNTVACPACHEKLITSPFVYHDGASELVICYVPEEWGSDEERQNVARALMMALWEEKEIRKLEKLLELSS
jgi:hypothetical protein